MLLKILQLQFVQYKKVNKLGIFTHKSYRRYKQNKGTNLLRDGLRKFDPL